MLFAMRGLPTTSLINPRAKFLRGVAHASMCPLFSGAYPRGTELLTY
jgi:hypothetical protein